MSETAGAAERLDDAGAPVDERVGEVLVSESELADAVARIGAAIGRDYAGLDPLLVGVLRGAYVFMADLTRAIPFSVEVDFLACSSYGASTTSSGVVRIVKDLDTDIAGRHVILVEDIVDTGLTLAHLREVLATRHPASVEVAALLVREAVRPVDLATLRYVGVRLPDDWVVGYGLDAGQRWRNLRAVHRWQA